MPKKQIFNDEPDTIMIKIDPDIKQIFLDYAKDRTSDMSKIIRGLIIDLLVSKNYLKKGDRNTK